MKIPNKYRYVEEFATSNFVGLKKTETSFTYTTPLSNSILPSITNISLSYLASKFGWRVERRQIPWEEIKNGGFDEIGAVGTAVVITPIKKIDREIRITEEIFPIKDDIKTLWEDVKSDKKCRIESVSCDNQFQGLKMLYDAYRNIQREGKDEFGWMYPSEGI